MALADNFVYQKGTILRDVEVNTNRNGNPYVKFTLQVKGTNKKRLEYIDCIAYIPSVIDSFGGELYEGETVAVYGVLQNHTWTDSVGISKSSLEVAVNKVIVFDEEDGENVD